MKLQLPILKKVLTKLSGRELVADGKKHTKFLYECCNINMKSIPYGSYVSMMVMILTFCRQPPHMK